MGNANFNRAPKTTLERNFTKKMKQHSPANALLLPRFVKTKE